MLIKKKTIAAMILLFPIMPFRCPRMVTDLAGVFKGVFLEAGTFPRTVLSLNDYTVSFTIHVYLVYALPTV